MSARDHTQIEELMAVAALGGLDPDDQRTLDRERAAHEPCDECRDIETSFGEIAGRLAFSLDPEPLDMAMADRIMALGGRVTTIPDAGPAALPEFPQAPPSIGGYRPARDPWRRRWAVAVGVAAVLVIALVVALAYVPGLKPVGTHASAAQRFIRFQPADGSSGAGELAMAYTPGAPGVVLWGSDMPDPGAGNVYELWMITGTTPTSAGCVQPTDGRIAVSFDASVAGADQMAVTEESSACPSAPTNPIAFSAPLTA